MVSEFLKRFSRFLTMNGNKTIGLFFHKSESLIDEKFENLTSLIDGLANGVFGFHPYTGYEDDLKKFIRSTKDEYETIFVKIDSSGVYFGHLKIRSKLK